MNKGEQTREWLLKCAEKAFSKKGYYETQVSDIVKLARVAKGTIYQYFKNKQDIFMTLLDNYTREWEQAVKLDIKDFRGDMPAIDYALGFLRHRLEKTAIFFSENEDRTKIVLRIGVGVNEVFESVMRVFENKVLARIMHDIALGQRQGHIPKDLNLETTGNAILGAVLRVSYYYFVINRKSLKKMSLEKMIDDSVKLAGNTLRMR
ncbi:MAG: hypothetical protein A2W19_11265 [Spirochaetes bacterium RBG_16_49_21]|nr:MAG: hypothetical protein A2W19_11265 [Spirochaetes bacterium RBG_16_49_21]